MATPLNTEIEISSFASQLCGHRPFTTYASGGNMGKAAEPAFQALVLAELGSQKWRFALENTQLSAWQAIPDSEQFDGWEYKHDLPQDMLILHSVWPKVMYRRWGPENGWPQILAQSDDSLNIVYSIDVPVNLWPNPFKLYISYALAEMLALTTARSPQLLATLREGVAKWKSDAQFADSQQEPPKNFQARPYQEVRYRRPGRPYHY